jgi:hypothetical protein
MTDITCPHCGKGIHLYLETDPLVNLMRIDVTKKEEKKA